MPNQEAPPEHAEALRDAYERLLQHYGEQHWWPKNFDPRGSNSQPTADEIAIGSVLVQHTSWRNVERALDALSSTGNVTLAKITQLATEELASMIRNAGPPVVKAKRLLALARFADERGGLERFLQGVADRRVADARRDELLKVHGIGPETADCILVYAGGASLPIVDAFLRRLLERHGWLAPRAAYGVLQNDLDSVFGQDATVHAEMHALVVRLGGDRCKARRPLCEGCPLEPLLPSDGPCAV